MLPRLCVGEHYGMAGVPDWHVSLPGGAWDGRQMLSLQNMISRCRPLLPVSGVYMLTNATHCQSMTTTWAPSQYPKRRLSVRSRKVSKPRDLYLELSDRSEIWQALRLLPMCLSNFKTIRQFKVPISWLRDFTRSYEKKPFRILRRGLGPTVSLWSRGSRKYQNMEIRL